ncbi:TPA: cation:proton antiporter [Candidatus Poribacteria bacterium]|nr:cation:proton antiporter [Candidatus Poribacteria bacterium]
MAIYILCLGLLLVGLYAVVVKRNLIKIVVGLIIIEYGVNLFLILIGYKEGGKAPIVPSGATAERVKELSARFVDPLPQALVVTSIVIGLGVIALVIALCIRLYEKYGTFDITKIRKLRG